MVKSCTVFQKSKGEITGFLYLPDRITGLPASTPFQENGKITVTTGHGKCLDGALLSTPQFNSEVVLLI